MVNCFMYWKECVDPDDLDARWMDPAVRSLKWLNVGEAKGQKVHLSSVPDGQPYLTQTEMNAVSDITVRRHIDSILDPEMVCAIAELESHRKPLIMQNNKKTKETGLEAIPSVCKDSRMVSSVRYLVELNGAHKTTYFAMKVMDRASCEQKQAVESLDGERDSVSA